MPAVSTTRACSVLLWTRVTPLSDHVFDPTVAVAVVQEAPLSVET